MSWVSGGVALVELRGSLEDESLAGAMSWESGGVALVELRGSLEDASLSEDMLHIVSGGRCHVREELYR
jgi:hypothetical protein